MTTTNTTYQGWTNRETWSVNLWIDNDEYSQDYWSKQAREAYLSADNTTAVYNLADQIKTEHEESMPELDGVWEDLLNASLSEVNWREIAKCMIDGIKDEVDEEENDDQDPTEPSECDLVTADHVHFYEHGMSKGVVFTVDEDAEESMTSQLKHFMDKDSFWPNVWFESDHGNYHLMCL